MTSDQLVHDAALTLAAQDTPISDYRMHRRVLERVGIKLTSNQLIAAAAKASAMRRKMRGVQ